MREKWEQIRFTNDHARLLLARFIAVYGDWSVQDEGQRKLLMREYVEQLGGFRPIDVNQAASTLIRTGKQWPKVSEIVATVHAQIRERHDRSVHWCAEEGRACDKPRSQCCGAPLPPAEVAKRAAFMAKLKAENPRLFGGTKPQDGPAKDPETYDVQQSDCSETLRAIMQRRSAA